MGRTRVIMAILMLSSCVGLLAAPAAAQDGAGLWTTSERATHAEREAAAAERPIEPPPVPLQQKGAGSQWQIGGGLAGGVYSLHPRDAGARTDYDADGERAGVDLSVIYRLTPVVDDASPRSLQPFLQRTSAVALGVSGGGFETHQPGRARSRTEEHVGARASVDGYVTRSFALTGGVRYDYSHLDDDRSVEQHTLSPSAGFGVHAGDTRFDASYSFTADLSGDTIEVPRWGRVHLAWSIAEGRQVSFVPWATFLSRGGLGGIDLAYYSSKDLGFLAGVYAGSGELYSEDSLDTRYGGYAGVSYWISRRLRLSASYGPRFTNVEYPSGSGYGELEHSVSVDGSVRLP